VDWDLARNSARPHAKLPWIIGDLRKDTKNRSHTLSRKSLGNQQVEPYLLFKLFSADCH
jgi:hypothetical protein